MAGSGDDESDEDNTDKGPQQDTDNVNGNDHQSFQQAPSLDTDTGNGTDQSLPQAPSSVADTGNGEALASRIQEALRSDSGEAILLAQAAKLVREERDHTTDPAPMVSPSGRRARRRRDRAVQDTSSPIYSIKCEYPLGATPLTYQSFGITEMRWFWQLVEYQPYEESFPDDEGLVPLLEELLNSRWADQVQKAYKTPSKKVRLESGARTRSMTVIATRPVETDTYIAAVIDPEWFELDDDGEPVRPRHQQSSEYCVAHGVGNAMPAEVDRMPCTVSTTSTNKNPGKSNRKKDKKKNPHQRAIVGGKFNTQTEYFRAQSINGMGLIQHMAAASCKPGCGVRVIRIELGARGFCPKDMLKWLIGAEGSFVCQFDRHVVSFIDGVLHETDPSYPIAINLRTRPMEDAIALLKTMGINGISVVRKVVVHEESKVSIDSSADKENALNGNKADKRPLSSPDQIKDTKRPAHFPSPSPRIYAAGRGDKAAVQAATVEVEEAVRLCVQEVEETTASGRKMEAIFDLIGARVGTPKSKLMIDSPLEFFNWLTHKINGGMLGSGADYKMHKDGIKYMAAMTLIVRELPALLEAGKLAGVDVYCSASHVQDTMVRVIDDIERW
jgi:hypothetical protein